MFPGQPLQIPAELPDDRDFTEICGLARANGFIDLGTMSWHGVESSESVKLQVYGVAMSLYRARRLRLQGVIPALIAEHSMGIYPAMAAAGSLSEEAVLELTFRAGACMATMGTRGEFSLGCVTGLTLEPLLSIAENHGVFMANHNTSCHFLLCGERAAVEEAMAEALVCGAFSARTFPCDAPLHTPMMAEIADDLRTLFDDFRYGQPAVPLISHIDQEPLTGGDIPGFLLRELCEPVYWEKTYLALVSAGAKSFFEVGAGESLKKYNRWISTEKGGSPPR